LAQKGVSTVSRGRKRVFLGFSIIALFVLFMAALALVYMISKGRPQLLAWGLLVFVGVVLLFLSMGILSLTGAFIWNKGIPRGIAVRAVAGIFPFSLRLAKMFGIDEDIVRRSFLQVHNELARREETHLTGQEILVLAPICLQKADCRYKISVEVSNCRRCGRCPVNGLLALQDDYAFHLAVSTGGTRARQLIKDLKPKGVVAIACERDLASGIQDTRPLKVLGVTNDRPRGPCFETEVDLAEVEEALLNLLGKQESISLPKGNMLGEGASS
jgi:hypothetical protein